MSEGKSPQQGAMVDGAQLADLLESRAAVYAMLARLYRSEVDEGLLEDLHERLYPQSTGSKALDEGYRLVATYLSNLWDDSLEDLEIDYAACFISSGIDGHAAAYPFESVYTSEKRLMMQDARDEVLAVYRSQGMDKAEGWKESEDHIALELEFMGLLSQRSAESLRAGDAEAVDSLISTQLNFLEDHLCSWVPLLTADLRRFAKTDFYRGLAWLTDGYLDMDRDFLREASASQSVPAMAGRLS